MNSTYHRAIEHDAARTILANAQRKAMEKQRRLDEADEAAKPNSQRKREARQRLSVVASAFPNNTCGYQRRERKPSVRALTPRERFCRLAATYLASPFAAKPTDKSPSAPPPGRKYIFAGYRRIERVEAPTKSEARAKIKLALGLRTTAGLEVLAA